MHEESLDPDVFQKLLEIMPARYARNQALKHFSDEVNKAFSDLPEDKRLIAERTLMNWLRSEGGFYLG